MLRRSGYKERNEITVMAPIGCVIQVMRSVGAFFVFMGGFHALPIAMCRELLYVVVDRDIHMTYRNAWPGII